MSIPLTINLSEVGGELSKRPYKVAMNSLHGKYKNGGRWLLVNADASQRLCVPAGSADSIITSPPYSQGMKYLDSNDPDPDSLVHLMSVASATWLQVAKPNCILWLNLKPRVGPQFMLPWRVLEAVSKAGWNLVNTFAWVFSATTPGRSGEAEEVSWGHFTPITSKRKVHSGFEMVFQFVLGEGPELNRLAAGTPYADKSNIKRFGAEGRSDLRCRGNVWCIPYPTKNETGHPCPFPPDLAKRCLQLQDLPKGSLVFDPFCGSGSVGVAALQMGLDFVGTDLSLTYLAKSHERLSRDSETFLEEAPHE
jgi:site-specific DNA-methyltransferase (adenine-specific)